MSRNKKRPAKLAAQRHAEIDYVGCCFTLRGPSAVRGYKGGSLTVQCHYNSGWETYVKWWCRGTVWSSCKFVVRTTGSEQEVKKDHVSIKDNQKNRIFTVTMEQLREDDADVYWCGIEKSGPDLGVQVRVSVDPAPVTSKLTHSSPSSGSLPVASRQETVVLKLILPIIFAVFLLLLVAASLLAWRMMKQQKKAAGPASEQVLQPLEGDICYANLTLHDTGTGPTPVSSRKKASARSVSCAQADQADVEYVTMGPVLKEEVSYASLSLGTSEQELTYCNVGRLMARVPRGSEGEATEYSTIRKP
ncbi:PREDICTED: CMRF35-like molecule 1 [Elephantulus edwardii]|uniref:CMRF35-like molecule 1 n=1 Tax=Elephantulus edwardii TaxID=28737 RepID=UPI0003F08AF9|nr:PREDICTED: CMRF35-like molecule 1 [Elephantulus edwardii]